MGSGTDESSGRWMVGRRLVFACVVSGRRGLVVEVDRYAIAQRKLGYSMGLILDARGRYPVDPWVTVFTLFLHSKLHWKFIFGKRPEPGTRWVGVFMMMTNIRVKH